MRRKIAKEEMNRQLQKENKQGKRKEMKSTKKRYEPREKMREESTIGSHSNYNHLLPLALW